jgi:hypothetical protein
MTLGLYEERARRRQRFRWNTVKWIIGLGLIGGAGAFAYQSGSALAQRELDALGQRLKEYETAVDSLQQENAQLRYSLEQAQARMGEQQARYERDVPQGQIAELLRLAQDKLQDGVTLDRLAFLIGAASNQRDCDKTPDTKRFIVKTPLYKGANDWVGFADSTITVTAVGQSAVNEDGKAEAWFDPAQEITFSFTHIGGKTTRKTGILPLQHAFVVGDREHRFQMVAGEQRGFVEVAADSCAFP